MKLVLISIFEFISKLDHKVYLDCRYYFLLLFIALLENVLNTKSNFLYICYSKYIYESNTICKTYKCIGGTVWFKYHDYYHIISCIYDDKPAPRWCASPPSYIYEREHSVDHKYWSKISFEWRFSVQFMFSTFSIKTEFDYNDTNCVSQNYW